jgi:hypothetical protein
VNWSIVGWILSGLALIASFALVFAKERDHSRWKSILSVAVASLLVNVGLEASKRMADSQREHSAKQSQVEQQARQQQLMKEVESLGVALGHSVDLLSNRIGDLPNGTAKALNDKVAALRNELEAVSRTAPSSISLEDLNRSLRDISTGIEELDKAVKSARNLPTAPLSALLDGPGTSGNDRASSVVSLQSIPASTASSSTPTQPSSPAIIATRDYSRSTSSELEADTGPSPSVFTLLPVGALDPNQGIPPARWTLNTAESKEFPRGFVVAIEKYRPQYRTVDAKTATKVLLDIYKDSDLSRSAQLWPLSSDALLPLGDGLLGATAEYGTMQLQMNRARYASDAVYESYKSRLFKSMAVITAATTAIGRKCDVRMVGLLRRLNFTDEMGRGWDGPLT